MSTIVPIAISIVRCNNQYLFLKRKNPPYENLWSMIGGKIGVGEHIADAAKREIMEETGTQNVDTYEYRGIVSERLVLADNTLSAHFLIFVGSAKISDYRENHREGELALFSLDELNSLQDQFVPSDLRMFSSFRTACESPLLYEAELVHEDGRYTLRYYRKARD